MRKDQRMFAEKEIKQYIAEIMAGDETHVMEFRSKCENMFNCDITRRRFYVSDAAQDEEDIFQDVMEKVFMSLKNYNAEYPFAVWFYSVCHSVEVDYIEKFKHTYPTVSLYEALGDDEDSGCLVDTLSTSSNVEECNVYRECIMDALFHLQDNYRQAITLVYLRNCKVKDAARFLNTTESVVANWLFRGRKKMKKFFETQIPELAYRSNKGVEEYVY